MWRRVGLLSALLGAASAAHLDMKVFKEAAASGSSATVAPAEASATSSATASASGTASATASTSGSDSDSDSGWSMTKVKSVVARVQGDKPVWNDEAGAWLSKYGDTTKEAYMNNLDTVNMASVEGALMYVQAEGINVGEQSVKCHRKNDMQYVVFYEIELVQPTYSIKYYESHVPPEYGEFVAMDGAKCTDEGDDLSEACKVYYGLEGAMDLGPAVGANLQTSDPRAPYPGNYWFSYPNSCAQKLRADKTDECRAKYPGGLCPMGKSPDGVKCTFSYKILGHLNIDDLVGITEEGYDNYTAFCEAGGIEFKAKNTGHGFDVDQCLPFWEDPGDSDANAERATAMVKMYNELASNGTSKDMVALPSVPDLTKANPPCYKNSAKCASAANGCSRTLYSQICQVCKEASDSCEVAPKDFSFPELSLPSSSSSSGSFSGSSSGTGKADALSDSSSPVASTLATAVLALAGVVIAGLV